MAVNVVKIHHEGGGPPNDVPKDGYSVWIGRTGYQLVRPPWKDTSTLNLNHVVMGVCFSGQRQENLHGQRAYPVTLQELAWLRGAVNEARFRGWVTAYPQVSPHDSLYGSASVCPGSLVYDKWPQIVDACHAPFVPVPAPEDDDMEGYRYPKPADPLRYSGAVVDRANKRVTLYGNAKIVNDGLGTGPFVAIPTSEILTSYPEVNGFCVVGMDTAEFHFHWA